jgi:Domain of unknown function (DUF4349)
MPATEYAELIAELRALPSAAPTSLRDRVRSLGEPAPRRALPPLPSRRALLVLAPVCVFALLCAAVVHGVLNSGRHQTQAVGALDKARLSPNVHWGAAGAAQAPKSLTFVPPAPGRHQDYQASMTVRVKDLDALTDRTNEAMRVARSFGGYVVSLQQSTQSGRPGEADLTLRIPVGRVESALVQLSELGTVLSRQVSIVDLEQVLQQQRARILRLKLYIARATEQLKGDLPADVRLRLQLQVQAARQSLAEATRSNKSTLTRAALSTVSLALTTEHAEVPVAKSGTGRFERAAREAGSFLASAGAVVLFLLIVLAPVLVLVAAMLLGLRAYRRREERRLLAA